MADQPNEFFDAKSYLESEGMRFKGVDDTGSAIVELDNGEEGRINFRELLKKEGVNPAMPIEYNSPDSALNESPVGLIDRLKLSFGNTKGGAQYLRQKFEDATVGEMGELVVKDKGVWKKVDLDGLGDDSGWKASELIGDLLDVTGDLAVGAGSLAATAATGGGAGAIIAAGGAGAGGASALKGVLGRVMGTYDATPEEAMKDIALDAVLGATGEAVALGAAKLLGPTLKRGFQKITSLGEDVQDMMAKTLSSVDPETPPGTYRTLFKNGDEVLKIIDDADKEALKRVTAPGAERAAAGTQSATMTELRGQVLQERAIKAARDVISDENGMLGLQSQASKFYENTFNEIAEKSLKAGDFAQIDATTRQNAGVIKAKVQRFLAEGQLLGKNGKIRPDEFMQWVNERGGIVSPETARKMVANIRRVEAFADGLQNKVIRSADDIRSIVKIQKELTDILDTLPRDRRELLNTQLKGALDDISKATENALPPNFRAGLSDLNSQYRVIKTNISKLTNGVDSGSKSFDDVASLLEQKFKLTKGAAPSPQSAEAQAIIETIKKINPTAAEKLNRLDKTQSAIALAGYRAAEALTVSGALARTGAFAARKVAAPAAMTWSKLQRKANLKSFLGSGGYQMMRDAASLIKQGGNRLVQRPDELGAALTALISATQYKDTPK